MEADNGQAKKQQLDPKKEKFNKIREEVSKREEQERRIVQMREKENLDSKNMNRRGQPV